MFVHVLSVFFILVVYWVLFRELSLVGKQSRRKHGAMTADMLFTSRFSNRIFPVNKEIGNINRKLNDLQVEIDNLASSIQKLKGRP